MAQRTWDIHGVCKGMCGNIFHPSQLPIICLCSPYFTGDLWPYDHMAAVTQRLKQGGLVKDNNELNYRVCKMVRHMLFTMQVSNDVVRGSCLLSPRSIRSQDKGLFTTIGPVLIQWCLVTFVVGSLSVVLKKFCIVLPLLFF